MWDSIDRWRFGPYYKAEVEKGFNVPSEVLFWMLVITAIAMWMLWVTGRVIKLVK